MKKTIMIIAMVAFNMMNAQLFINEIDYDQPGGDSGEFIEIAGLEGTYNNVTLEFINGNGGSVYETTNLGSLTISDQVSGYGFHVEYISGIQNGAPDGVQLLIDGVIIDAVAYEGSLNDSDGNPMEEAGEDYQTSEETAQSVSRIGVDGSPWEETFITPGAINTNQVLDPEANYPPTADAGGDQIVDFGDIVTLDGSNSSDPDGTIVSYLWEEISDYSIELSSETDQIVTFTFPNATETTYLVFELTVTDDEGATNTVEVNITAYLLDQITIYEIQENISTYEGQIVNVVGVVTIGDSLLYPSYTKFYIQDESGRGIQIYNSSPLEAVYNRGDYIEVVGMVEVYNDDVEITSPTITLIDTGYELPEPYIAIGSETTNLNGTWANATGVLTDFWDSDYGFLKMTLTVDGAEVAAMFWNTAVPPADLAQFEEMVGEELSISGVITFYEGAVQLTCGYVSDIDDNSDPTLPVANAGADQAVEPGTTVTLDGSASSDDVSIVEYEWIQLSGITVTLSDEESAITTFTAPSEVGDLTFQLTVWDNDWNESSDEVTISVIGTTTIFDIQYTTEQGDYCYETPMVGNVVTTSGIVTHIKPDGSNNFFLQDPSGDSWSGIYVYDTSVSTSIGDEIEISATVNEYYSLTQLIDVTASTFVSSGNTINPIPLSASDIGIECNESAESYESMLVSYSNLTFETVDEYGNWTATDGSATVMIDDYYFDGEWPTISEGQTFEYVAGVIGYNYSEFKLYPRNINDFTNLDVNAVIVINDFRISSVYPNPFNPVTTISYELPAPSSVQVTIYNVNGQLIETLVNRNKVSGNYDVTWDASNYTSGIYFVKLVANGKTISEKITLIK